MRQYHRYFLFRGRYQLFQPVALSLERMLYLTKLFSICAYLAQSCTSGRAGGLICEPLKAVWPAYAGIVTRISLVDRASYLLSLVPLCTLESGLHPAPPLTRNSPSPKSSVPQSSSLDP